MLSVRYIHIVIPLIFLTTCTSAEKTKNAKQKWDVLTSGALCDITNPRQVLIKNQSDFGKLWQESFSFTSIESKPVVDFTTKWVIAAYLGKVTSGGHTIEVKDISSNENTYRVILKHNKPGSGCVTTAAIEYPFIFVSIDHLPIDKASFTTTTEQYKCE